ncbi:hypothetical protein Tco_0679316 [Tanacetum coccineum]|uniref:CCHC-type domain-containing protein n=1 Tax=Tanacetum coccineum TaxID=301880 RepID=A0ABQ4XIY8_9ASTR
MTSFDYRLNPIYAIKECSSCGSLYTSNCGCSKGSLEDKILVPKPPRNCARCAKCGTPVDGPYCQGCALLRKEFMEGLLTNCVENEFFKDFQDTSESSDDNTNVVNAPREPIVVNQDPSKNSSPSPLHIDHCCHECGDSLDGIFCRQCTCKSCGKGAHYGYNCPPKVPITSNSEPCKNQTIDEPLQNLQVYCNTLLFLAHAKDVVALNTMEFVFIVKLEMKYKSMFQFRTLLTILQVLQTTLHNHNAYHTLVNYVGTTLITVTIVHLKSRFNLTLFPGNGNRRSLKSSVENLVPIPSESESIPDKMCDVPLCNNPTSLEAFKEHSETIIDSNDDSTSSDDDSYSVENFDYVDAHSRLMRIIDALERDNPTPYRSSDQSTSTFP